MGPPTRWDRPARSSSQLSAVSFGPCLGPSFNYSDTWQLVINTLTTVLTFLAVFLIQHTQNKDGRALQLKLDELIQLDKDRAQSAD